MFTGIEDVDWASMGHAYTDSATDVPELLWGLASDDPARRDIALDGMYGAVHHQGDVYDSTVACVPFLFELVATPTVADRGSIVGLLRSIAGEKEPDPEELGGVFEDEEEDAAWIRPFLEASELIRGRVGFFLELLDDPDPRLRAALPGALAHLHSDPVRVFAALRGRLPVEEDPEAVRCLARALGRLSVDHARTLGAEAGPLLRDLVDRTSDPELRMTALAQLALRAPDSLPRNTSELALEVMRLACEAKHGPDADAAAESEPERARTDTMVSYLRELEAERRKSIDADVADDLLEDLHRALGDRTQTRFELLNRQLCSQDWGQRMAAVRMGGMLLTGWRAPNELPVFLLARQLVEEDDRLSESALSELGYVAPIAHVVGDILAACTEVWADEWEPAGWERTLFGRALGALARQGDARAVPALVEVLEEGGDVPEYLAGWIEAIGSDTAAVLGPVLHRRLSALPPDEWSREKDRLIDALRVLAPPEALPLFLGMLEEEQGRATHWRALRVLARYGRSADGAAPRIRELVTDGALSTDTRLDAAEALWAVSGEAGPVLPVVREGLDSDRWHGRSAALRIIAALGRAAAPLAPRLRELMTAGGSDARAAVALWRVTGDAVEVLPVLIEAWTAAPAGRPETAACLVEMGPAAAPALPLIRRELASPRRHRNDNSTGNVRYDVASDEALLRDCRRLVAALDG
ncbi:HEAT repeat domain-containing protein [Streptomyces sp. NPDC088253]|uniref:HEAT repeat domain-containing protein n=1 Tax=Streptomyces sp. NPDC088253 TaxID=3365846 RepID=UPI00382CF03E